MKTVVECVLISADGVGTSDDDGGVGHCAACLAARRAHVATTVLYIHVVYATTSQK